MKTRISKMKEIMKQLYYFVEKNKGKVSIRDKVFGKKRKVYQKKFYELTYVIEDYQQKAFFELAERFRKVNGWNEKEMLQFAVTAMNQIDLELKLKFLEGIIEDLEKGEQTVQ